MYVCYVGGNKMTKRPKIVKVEEPKEEGYWSLYSVYFDYGNGKPILSNMYKEEYLVLRCEEKLIKKGYKIKDLEKYKELIEEVTHRDIYDNLDGQNMYM